MNKKELSIETREKRMRRTNEFFTVIRNAGLTAALWASLAILWPKLAEYQPHNKFDEITIFVYFLMLILLACYSAYMLSTSITDYLNHYHRYKFRRFVVGLVMVIGLVVFVSAIIASELC